MRPHELRALVKLERPEWRSNARRLGRCHQIADLRELGRRRTPGPVFDYVDGGADQELTVSRNQDAFKEWELVPDCARDVTSVDTSANLFSRHFRLPLLCSPTGYTRMIHQAGEIAVSRAAARANVPYCLSTVASTSIEEVAGTGHPDLWFQLYVWRDREITRELIARAWAAGYRVLEVSVDVPVAGYRIRDVRNGLTIPPRLTAATPLGIARKPAYWINLLRGPAIGFANAPAGVGGAGGVTIENMSVQFDPSVTWEDIAALRQAWAGSLVVKGPLNPASARQAVDAGADGLHLSNHGGRQLDRTVPPIEMVQSVRAAVGQEITIIVDSGIRHGTDLAVALALGADAGAIGRAYLYGLMAAGEKGVDRALELLRAEFRRTMQLLGVTSVGELRARGPAALSTRGTGHQ